MLESIKGSDPKITLYRILRSVGESIQIYEDDDGNNFIRDGNFYRRFRIDDQGHLHSEHECHLFMNVTVKNKKFPPKPNSFA